MEFSSCPVIENEALAQKSLDWSLYTYIYLQNAAALGQYNFMATRVPLVGCYVLRNWSSSDVRLFQNITRFYPEMPHLRKASMAKELIKMPLKTHKSTQSSHQLDGILLAPTNHGQVGKDWGINASTQWLNQLEQLDLNAINPLERIYWMSSTREWLKFNLSPKKSVNPSVIEFPLNLICSLAYRLCDWALIIDIYQCWAKPIDSNVTLGSSPISTPNTSQTTMAHLQLAVAYWQMGSLEQAKHYLHDKRHDLAEGHPLEDFYQQVCQDIQLISPAYNERLEGDILLAPLEEQHLSGFSWVYNDPQIANLCNLPTFNDDDQWFEWLNGDQCNPNKEVFAVIHNQWGLIGSVSIEVHDSVGFFYYWLGLDFQGGGHGPKAVKLLLKLATRYMALTCCYAKVYQHNKPSHKALNKLGFTQLPFELAPPNQDQVYYYSGPTKPETMLRQELSTLMSITDIDNRLV